jgi:hypothetical protein
MAGETLTDPADLVREACDQIAGLLPRLRRETAQPSPEGLAAGTIGRHTVAPVPGNPPAFYAKTGIDATARQLEGILLYAAGARRPGPLSARGGGDGGTLKALKAITRLIARADDDLYRMVVSELEQRLGEAQQVRAIDEAERWRYVRARPCPRCGCYALKVLENARGQPAGRIGCFGKHAEYGEPCRAAWPGLADIIPDLARADDLEG